MTDETRNYLLSEIETLQATVFKAGALNAKTLGAAAEKHLENVLPLVALSPPLEEASYLAVAQIAQFARLLYGQAPVADIEQARRSTLVAVDALAALLLASLQDQPAQMQMAEPAAEALPLAG
jgi:hypothetical protein